jgi:Flp pilus assembly protein TadD
MGELTAVPSTESTAPATGRTPWGWAGPAFALVALVLLAYLPAFRGGWIWDDDHYVTRNTTLRTADGLRRIWFEPKASPQYYPVTFTSFWIEQKLWGPNPAGYHVTNALLHAAACVVLWRILRRLNVPGAWVIAAAWGAHPVNAESVAWVTERKNVLSGLFYLSALLVYFHPTRPPKRPATTPSDPDAAPPIDPDTANFAYARFGSPAYWTALALFVLALLSKSVTATWPAVVLLIVWWKRGTIRPRDVLSLVPFFALGLAMGAVTSLVERFHVGAGGDEFAYSLAQRCTIAGRVIAFYAAKDVLPVNLSFIYRKWDVEPWQWVFPLAVAAVVAALYFARRRLGRGPLTAVLFFIGTLVPALGFINVYPMRFSFVADHFQYLASIGVVALVVGTFARWWRARGRVPAVLLLAILVALTWQRNTVLASAEHLWADTIRKNDRAWMAHTNLGILRLDRGEARLAARVPADDDLRAAAAEFDATRALRPDLVEPYLNLGRVAELRGDTVTAERWLREAQRTAPESAEPHFHLGRVLVDTGRVGDGIAEYHRALDLNPRHEPARVNLGGVLAAQGKIDEAIEQYHKALEIDPDSLFARVNLGNALLAKGNKRDAAEQFRRAITIEPRLPQALDGLRAAEN